MSDSPTKLQLCPLHTHSTYSVLDGVSTIDEYLKWCVQNGAPALSLTDHGYQIGNLELYHKARKAGITPIPGCEFYVAPDSDYKFNSKPYDYYHVTAWAINETGYRNLMHLGSLSWKADEIQGWSYSKKSGKTDFQPKSRVVKKWGTQLKPRITIDELLEHNEGIVLGSGCLIGMLGKALISGEGAGAKKNLDRLLEVYRGRLFMEIMPHSCDHDYNRTSKQFEPNECTDFSPTGDLQYSVNQKIIEYARAEKLPLILTVDSHFVAPSSKPVQDVLLQNGDPQGWRFYNSYHMMTTEDAWSHWKKAYGNDAEQRKIFTEAVESNHIIAGVAKGLSIKDEYHQPTPILPPEISSAQVSEGDKLKLHVLRQIKFHGRMKDDPKWRDRLAMELSVIADNGTIDFLPYFIFLEHWGRWAAEHSILSAPGRGSGAGSLLCYLLKITHLDPFRFELPFERFLSSARIHRGKFPDIDWDTGNRDLLVSKLHEHYGPEDKIAQCSTLQTIKSRSALRDACRVLLGWSGTDPRVDEVCKSISLEPQGVNSKDFLVGYRTPDGDYIEGELLNNKKLADFMDAYPQVKEMVLSLLGIPKAISRHASAYLISNRPIYESSPTMDLDGSGFLVTQYNANAAFNSVEKAGLLKFDLLRIVTLDFISGAVRSIQKELGYKVWDEEQIIDGKKTKVTFGELRIDQLPMPDGRVLDLYDLPEDDAVFRSISRGETTSCFQISSSLMTGFCKRIKPGNYADLSDIVALVRPGPLDAKIGVFYQGNELTMTEAYILRKHGDIPVTYPHEGIRPITQDTQGVFVYQEQLSRAFIELAGYSAEEADYLREALGKKKKQEVEKAVPELKQRLKDRGWNESQVEVFVNVVMASSAYSFNRSHSAAYGMVAYQSAFIKHHFPLHWWGAGVLNNCKVDDIKEKGYISAVKDILQMPHVNGPTNEFRLENGKIHAPLYLIEKVGDASCMAIENERKARGPFSSFQNFFERVSKGAVDQGVVNNLIICGAFSLVEPDKTQRDLLKDFYYLRRLVSLKAGRGKTGEDLRKEVLQYQSDENITGKYLEIPILQLDAIQLEIARVKALPVHKVDVHKDFKSYLPKFLYGDDGTVTYRLNNDLYTILVNEAQLVKEAGGRKELTAGFIGLLKKYTEFSYNDKRTGQKVTALKLEVTNDGDTLEIVLWPDLYASLGVPSEDKLIFAVGSIREAREPGKWSMSARDVVYR
jgi:DNA polymerase-3 subunit alpha